jgi:DNA primase
MPGELLHVCEGEFNAKSLKLSGLWAAACGGKNMTDKQLLILADYRICLCLDRDKAGKAGTTVMSNAVSMLESATGSRDKLFVVRPPKGYNDWNEMYIALGDAVVHHYIKKNSRPLTYYFPQGMGAD